MTAATKADKDQVAEHRRVLSQGTALLGQQIWCWGQDILRPEGNRLLEIGFERIKPPASRQNCSSVYTLELPAGRRVVLRGFGVFFGDDQLGGVFLPRYEFRPGYTSDPALECPPWSDSDLPKLATPAAAQRRACAALTIRLLDWIEDYEQAIAASLGIDYRRATLSKWHNRKQEIIPAEAIAREWRKLSVQLTQDPEPLFG